MYLAIIALPLLGSIVSGFFGRKVGVSGAQFITSLCMAITTCLAILVFNEVGLNGVSVSVLTFRWVDSESLNVLWGFNFDSLTVSMLIPVLMVSFLVHIYSIGYMSHDPHNQRFFSYLSLFTFMMIILVTANNFLLMFVGWEGVGVCSYLLVSFWFTRIAANQSSMSAFLTNRVGDCFLTLGMFIMLIAFGNLDYTTVFSLAPFVSENVVTMIGVCLLIGAMAKSSQVGLHVWLPLAMEGPTPVSALIHAATMVTAGVYLLMRASPLIEYSPTVLILCLWIGGITTLFSSLIGLFQQDIKKVIAYSTMSQLGMMVIAIGLSSYNVALFHLINHAFYKGLLFLGAGAVIHAVGDNQDFRRYGGLLIFLPLTYTVMLIASLSLVAFPFMTGFYSKDFILESAYGQFKYSSIAIYFTATVGAMFTALYSIKVLYLTFLTNANGPIINYNRAHESDVFMSLPLVILALFSIFFGYLTKDMFIGLASGFFIDNSLFIHPTHEINLETEFAVPSFFKLLPLVLTITLAVCFFVLFELSSKRPLIFMYLKFTRLSYNMFSFFNLRFLVEYIYNRFLTNFVLKSGGQTTKVLDKGSVELLGPYGLEKALVSLSRNLSKLDTGVVTSYALYILIALVLYVLMPYIYSKDISVVLLMLYSLLICRNLLLDEEQLSPKNDKIITDVVPLNNADVFTQDYIVKSSLLINYKLFPCKKFKDCCPNSYITSRTFKTSWSLFMDDNDSNEDEYVDANEDTSANNNNTPNIVNNEAPTVSGSNEEWAKKNRLAELNESIPIFEKHIRKSMKDCFKHEKIVAEARVRSALPLSVLERHMNNATYGISYNKETTLQGDVYLDQKELDALKKERAQLDSNYKESSDDWNELMLGYDSSDQSSDESEQASQASQVTQLGPGVSKESEPSSNEPTHKEMGPGSNKPTQDTDANPKDEPSKARDGDSEGDGNSDNGSDNGSNGEGEGQGDGTSEGEGDGDNESVGDNKCVGDNESVGDNKCVGDNESVGDGYDGKPKYEPSSPADNKGKGPCSETNIPSNNDHSNNTMSDEELEDLLQSSRDCDMPDYIDWSD